MIEQYTENEDNGERKREGRIVLVCRGRIDGSRKKVDYKQNEEGREKTKAEREWKDW